MIFEKKNVSLLTMKVFYQKRCINKRSGCHLSLLGADFFSITETLLPGPNNGLIETLEFSYIRRRRIPVKLFVFRIDFFGPFNFMGSVLTARWRRRSNLFFFPVISKQNPVGQSRKFYIKQ